MKSWLWPRLAIHDNCHMWCSHMFSTAIHNRTTSQHLANHHCNKEIHSYDSTSWNTLMKKTKKSPVCRQNFQMHFFAWKYLKKMWNNLATRADIYGETLLQFQGGIVYIVRLVFSIFTTWNDERVLRLMMVMTIQEVLVEFLMFYYSLRSKYI